ncbi:hypothetical protein DESC_190141 [Desulfosarcina cetonica]|nr:hypothetical protein DESC_190141 [Desulfosarcina cetonica]
MGRRCYRNLHCLRQTQPIRFVQHTGCLFLFDGGRFRLGRHGLAQSRIDAGKSHEGHGQDATDDQGDGRTAKRLGNVAQLELLPQTGHDHDGDGKAHAAEKGQGQGAAQVPAVGRILDADHVAHDGQTGEENGAVGGDQRQEDAEGLVQQGEEASDVHFHELYRGGDGEDVDDVAQNGQIDMGRRFGRHEEAGRQPGQWRAGHQHEGRDAPGQKGGDGDDEGHGGAHAKGHADPPGDTDEGADTHEIVQHEVVDQGRPQGDEQNIDKIVHGVVGSLRFVGALASGKPVDAAQQNPEGEKRAGRQHHDDPVRPDGGQDPQAEQATGAENLANGGDAGERQAESQALADGIGGGDAG